mgnify:CR=1 FL=1
MVEKEDLRNRIRRLLLGGGVAVLTAGWVLWSIGRTGALGPCVIIAFILLALFLASSRRYAPFAFTAWVAVFVAASMFYPLAFRTWWGFELSALMVPLIQIIMFGMGTQLTLADFARVFSMPQGVIAGLVLQFSIMPFVGKGLAMIFTRHPEVAAGMVLIGSCPGGVASNVMTYLAKGNVALSVTMTSCSTLAAPIMTPLMMKLLAGAYVEVKFMAMMLSILEMILVPVGAGLLVNWLLTRLRRVYPGAKGVAVGIMKGLPFVSMFAICLIIAIITALSRDDLLAGSFVVPIIIAVILHNVIGYALGYRLARWWRLNEADCRTVAIEVGLQNGGMASALAIEVLKSRLAAIPPAIFGPWMNMSGAMVASWWSARPPKDDFPSS